MIRRLAQSDIPEAERIWQICFGDSEAFIDEYFKNIVALRHSLGFFENGVLQADLFALPFRAKLDGTVYLTYFLAGCATLPEYRKRGRMRELIRHALFEMQKEGIAVTYLHPFLHSFYRRFGYETIAYVTRRQVKGMRSREVRRYSSFDGLPEREMYAAYRATAERYDNAFIRSSERFSEWLSLLFADGGEAAVQTAEDETRYALFYMDGANADVFEWAAQKDAERFLKGIADGGIEYFEPAPPNCGKCEEFTMMRVLNPTVLLQNANLTAADFTIEIRDDFLDQRHTLRVISKGGGKNRVERAGGGADFSVSAAQAAALLAGAYRRGLSEELTRIFPEQSADFFETY